MPPPAPLTKGGDESSENDTKDKDDEDDHESRDKKIKKVETSNPFSTNKQTRNKNYFFSPTIFAKEHCLKIRGIYSSGRFITEDESKPDAWKLVAKSDRLVKRYSVFAVQVGFLLSFYKVSKPSLVEIFLENP